MSSSPPATTRGGDGPFREIRSARTQHAAVVVVADAIGDHHIAGTSVDRRPAT